MKKFKTVRVVEGFRNKTNTGGSQPKVFGKESFRRMKSRDWDNTPGSIIKDIGSGAPYILDVHKSGSGDDYLEVNVIVSGGTYSQHGERLVTRSYKVGEDGDFILDKSVHADSEGEAFEIAVDLANDGESADYYFGKNNEHEAEQDNWFKKYGGGPKGYPAPESGEAT